jgi:hypothetical protein
MTVPDPLSDMLALLKPRAYGFRGLDVGGEWSLRLPAQEEVIRCYAVHAGACGLWVDGLDVPVELGAGDFVLLPQGRLFERVRFASECATLMPAADSGPIGSHPPCVVKQQALEILNSRFRSTCLDGLPSSGSNPVRFDLLDVLRLARRAISTAELGWRRGRNCRNIQKTLERHGVERIASDFWSRSHVEKLLSERLI